MAFPRWVKAQERLVAEPVQADLLARLLMAQTRDGQEAPWLKKQGYTDLNKLTQKIKELQGEILAKGQAPLPTSPRDIKDDPLLIAMFVLPVVSVVWSVDHGTSARRVVALVMTGIYCVYLARRLSPEDFLRRLLLALFVGGLLSLLYTALDPAQAIEHSMINSGSWKGVYGHKAILGRIAAVAVTVSVYVRPRHVWEGPLRWITIAIFVFLAIKSQSRASWLMMGGGVGFKGCGGEARRQAKLVAAAQDIDGGRTWCQHQQKGDGDIAKRIGDSQHDLTSSLGFQPWHRSHPESGDPCPGSPFRTGRSGLRLRPRSR